VGNRGLNPVQRLLMGSFSNYIVNHSPCDVYVARK